MGAGYRRWAGCLIRPPCLALILSGFLAVDPSFLPVHPVSLHLVRRRCGGVTAHHEPLMLNTPVAFMAEHKREEGKRGWRHAFKQRTCRRYQPLPDHCTAPISIFKSSQSWCVQAWATPPMLLSSWPLTLTMEAIQDRWLGNTPLSRKTIACYHTYRSFGLEVAQKRAHPSARTRQPMYKRLHTQDERGCL